MKSDEDILDEEESIDQRIDALLVILKRELLLDKEDAIFEYTADNFCQDFVNYFTDHLDGNPGEEEFDNKFVMIAHAFSKLINNDYHDEFLMDDIEIAIDQVEE